MTNLRENLDRALALHREGQLRHAQAIYEDILQVQPNHAAALHFLGVIANQSGDPTRAVAMIGAAIKLEPYDAAMHFHMGNALRSLRNPVAALASYTRALDLKPDLAEAYGNRGIVLCELNECEAALQDYDKAISIRAGFAEVHSNRGDLLRGLGRLEDALKSCDLAIRLKPDLAAGHCNRGLVLRELKQWDAAMSSLDRAIAISPDYAAAHYNRGLVLRELRQWDMALASYERAIDIASDYADAHRSRGILLKQMGQLDAALASISQAISIDPAFAEAYSSRGTVFHELNRFEEALSDYEQAIAIRAELAEAHSNRGATLREINELEMALASYDRAIAVDANFSEAYCNRATVLLALGDVEAAILNCDKAIALDADSSAAHLNRAMALLLQGNYADGWIEYEWRWDELSESTHGKQGRRNFPQPLWRGEQSLLDKTILLHSEQGLGDAIQFCRYVRLVADLGARVILEVPSALANLLGRLSGVAQLVVYGEPLPKFDYHCPLLSLPLAFKTTLATIPAQVPYLEPDPEKVRIWREKLGEKRKLRAGLVWSGGFRPDQPALWAVNKRRNIPLAKIAPLSHSAVEFFSLQKGQPAEGELAALIAQAWNGPLLIDHVNALLDFSDTAALIDQLDLVISVDTSTAHLAGALGKPVWLLNRNDTCWRWLQDRADSPWYPTMRIYRQKEPGNWDEVIQRVRTDLSQLVSGARVEIG